MMLHLFAKVDAKTIEPLQKIRHCALHGKPNKSNPKRIYIHSEKSAMIGKLKSPFLLISIKKTKQSTRQ